MILEARGDNIFNEHGHWIMKVCEGALPYTAERKQFAKDLVEAYNRYTSPQLDLFHNKKGKTQ